MTPAQRVFVCCVLLSSACATPTPTPGVPPPTPGPTTPEQPEQPEHRARAGEWGPTPGVDAQGRLLTGTGLCAIRSDTGSELRLEYGSEGQILRASASLVANCESGEDDDPRPALERCVLEEDEVRWSWEGDRVVARVHTVAVRSQRDDLAQLLEDWWPCLAKGRPVAVDSRTWSYDSKGQILAASLREVEACEASEIQESYHHTPGSLELRTRYGAGTADSRVLYTLDEAGRVVHSDWGEGAQSHVYDSVGRLLEIRRDGGETTRYAYTHDLVGEREQFLGEWWREREPGPTPDSTLVRLHRSTARDPRTFVIELEGTRPVRIEDEVQRWEFVYGGCDHAELATLVWPVAEILELWPTPPRIGPGAWEDSFDPLHAGRLPTQPTINTLRSVRPPPPPLEAPTADSSISPETVPGFAGGRPPVRLSRGRWPTTEPPTASGDGRSWMGRIGGERGPALGGGVAPRT